MDVVLHRARWADSNTLYHWRRQGEQAAWYTGRPVSSSEHDRWFSDRVANPAVDLWIAHRDGRPVGCSRVDSNGELTVYVDERQRGQGIGTAIARRTIDLTNHHRLKASIDHDNEAARALASRVGFTHRPDVDFYLCRL